MRGSIGLVIGLAVGAGGMYLGLKRPWEHHVQTTASDNPPVVIVPADAGVKAKPKRHHHGGGAPHTPGDPATAAGPSNDSDSDDERGDPGPSMVQLTAADRALEQSGDDTKLPAQNIDMAGGGDGEARKLEDSEISQTLNSQAGGVKDCIVQGATNTDLKATITIKLVVDGRGKIVKRHLEAPHYLLEHGLLQCTQRALARVHFPATGAPTLVTFPISLS